MLLVIGRVNGRASAGQVVSCKRRAFTPGCEGRFHRDALVSLRCRHDTNHRDLSGMKHTEMDFFKEI